MSGPLPEPTTAVPRATVQRELVLLAITGIAAVAGYALWPKGIESRALLSHGSGAVIALLAAVMIMRAARRPGAWRPGSAAGHALLGIGVVQIVALIAVMVKP